MANIDLTQYGITGTTEVVYNPSYEMLFEEETKPGLEGYEKGQVSELGAVNVMTGIYTGRSPKDKFIVMDDTSKDTVWWTSDEYKNDNHPAVPGSVEGAQGHRQEGAVQQAPVRRGCVLRREQGHPHGHPLHRGSRLAGSLRDQHVHHARPRKSWRTSSRTSSSTTPPRRRWRTTRSWASTPRPPSPSTSPAASRSSSTPGTAAR